MRRTRVLWWTLLASGAPAASHGTAALSFSHGHHSRVEAYSSTVAVEAQFFSNVDALFAIAAQNVARWTLTYEAAFLVDTVTILA